MKKNIKIMLLLVLSSILLLTGCSEKEEKKAKKDVVNKAIEIDEAVDEAADSADDQAVAIFNSMYEFYEGEGRNYSDVRTLVTQINVSNQRNTDNQIEIEGINEITKISKNSTYTVEFKKNSKGYINKIIITEE